MQKKGKCEICQKEAVLKTVNVEGVDADLCSDCAKYIKQAQELAEKSADLINNMVDEY